MQPKYPCSICRLGFREKALVAYHHWYTGDNHLCYKQRMCMRCWRDNYATILAMSRNSNDYDAPIPETCAACGEILGEDTTDTWSTWFRGNSRRDVVVTHCPHCAAQVRTLMMNGADRQEDRAMAGVRQGGAPLPNPPAFGRDDLPW